MHISNVISVYLNATVCIYKVSKECFTMNFEYNPSKSSVKWHNDAKGKHTIHWVFLHQKMSCSQMDMPLLFGSSVLYLSAFLLSPSSHSGTRTAHCLCFKQNGTFTVDGYCLWNGQISEGMCHTNGVSSLTYQNSSETGSAFPNIELMLDTQCKGYKSWGMLCL